MATQVGTSRGAEAFQYFQGMAQLAELISGLEAENRTLRQQQQVMGVELMVITKWIADTMGQELFNRNSNLYKDTHPDDKVSADIEKELIVQEGGNLERAPEVRNDAQPDSIAHHANPSDSEVEVDVDPPAPRQGHRTRTSKKPTTVASSGAQLKTAVIRLRRIENDPTVSSSLRRASRQSRGPRKNPAIARHVPSTSPVAKQNGRNSGGAPRADGRPTSKKCRFCRKEYQHPFQVKIHERIHTGERPFKCHFCNKAFSSKFCQKAHLKIHINERPFKCDVCSRTFVFMENLKRHKLIHTGERPHKCRFCKMKFRDRTSKTYHTLKVHTKRRPHECQYCDRKFYLASGKRIHEMSHTGERPHKCQHCEKTFRHRYNVKNHVERHHPPSN